MEENTTPAEEPKPTNVLPSVPEELPASPAPAEETAETPAPKDEPLPTPAQGAVSEPALTEPVSVPKESVKDLTPIKPKNTSTMTIVLLAVVVILLVALLAVWAYYKSK